jgi:hypothetical protein
MRSLISKESENDLFKNNLKFNYQETNSDGFLDEYNSNNNDEDGYDLFRGDESGSEKSSSSSSLSTNRMSSFKSHLIIKPIFLLINIFLVKILQ